MVDSDGPLLVTVLLSMSFSSVLNASPIWVILCMGFSRLGTHVAQMFQKCI